MNSWEPSASITCTIVAVSRINVHSLSDSLNPNTREREFTDHTEHSARHVTILNVPSHAPVTTNLSVQCIRLVCVALKAS